MVRQQHTFRSVDIAKQSHQGVFELLEPGSIAQPVDGFVGGREERILRVTLAEGLTHDR